MQKHLSSEDIQTARLVSFASDNLFREPIEIFDDFQVEFDPNARLLHLQPDESCLFSYFFTDGNLTHYQVVTHDGLSSVVINNGAIIVCEDDLE